MVFLAGDLNQAWNVQSDYFDLITCSLTLEHIENLNPIFAQAVQKLKNKGLFFISELHPIKQCLGSKARFETGGGTVSLAVFTHHISDFLISAKKSNFKLLELKEWFDEDLLAYPRLISFVFQKEAEREVTR